MVSASDEAPVTQLLARARAGDAQALGEAYSAVYDELKRAARSQLRRMRDAFETTALVHEAYLKLAGGAQLAAVDRNHLLALSARAMRQVLIDHARRRVAEKRGGAAIRVTLDERDGARGTSPEEVLALFDAIERLGEVDPRLRSVVEHRYLAGLTEDETAELLQVTTRTVQRDWAKARAWLYRQLYQATTS